MLTIYRKSDLSLMGSVASNMTTDQEIELNVIPNFGGVVDDYAHIETEEKLFHLELIDGVVTVVKDEPPQIIQAPTTEERLTAAESAIAALMGV